MKSTTFIVWLSAAAGAAVPGVALAAQGVDLRVGTWALTMVPESTVNLAGIPAPMRAQIEAEMRRPRTYRRCITDADIASLNFGIIDEDDDDICTVVTSTTTGTSGDVVRQCTGEEPRTETVHAEAQAPRTLRATMETKGSGGTTRMTITGTWVMAECRE
jgi:hypothetical protein